MEKIVHVYWKLKIPSNGISEILSKFENHADFRNVSKLQFTNIDRRKVYILHGCYDWSISKAAFFLAIRRAVFYWCPHGSLQKNTLRKGAIKKILFHFFLSSIIYFFSSGVIYVSAQERRRSLTMFRRKSTIITNGIEPIPQQNLGRNKTEPMNFVYIGRLDVFHKGIDLLADWGGGLGSTLAVYGPKPETIEKRFSGLDFKGPVYGDQKNQILSEARGLIMLSRYEGLPVVALEALRIGTPLIISDECNLSDAVGKYRCGFIVNNKKEFVEACNRLSSLTQSEFITYSLNAQLCFQKCFAKSKMIQQYQKMAKN